MKRIERLDAGRIARALARDAEGFCRRFFPDGRKVGNYWQMADTGGGAGRSLCIRLRDHGGRRAGKWVDHATGEFGDLLDLLEHHLAPMSFLEVLRYASGYLGDRSLFAMGQAVTGPILEPDGGRIGAGRRLFSAGHPIVGTLAERYLRNRSITRFGASLAFHPHAYLRANDGRRLEFPALLAAIRNNAGERIGCVRVFLNPSGVRFGAWQRASDLIVGEGLENTLSVGTALPQAALTACITANHLAAFVWPEATERVWIAHDNDHAGNRAAAILRDLVQSSGRQAHLLSPARDDFNSDLRSDGVDQLRHRLGAMISEQVACHDPWPSAQAA